MRRVLVLTVALAVMMALAVPARAGGNGPVQLSAIGTDDGPCGIGSDFDITITGTSEGWSLDGCLGQTFGPGQATPAGNFKERGTEMFVGDLLFDGDVVASGSFETTYLFTGKFEDLADPATEIFGRCQHPITKGSGEDGFEGATGRLDFKDDVDAGNFVMRGHIKVPNA